MISASDEKESREQIFHTATVPFFLSSIAVFVSWIHPYHIDNNGAKA